MRNTSAATPLQMHAGAWLVLSLVNLLAQILLLAESDGESACIARRYFFAFRLLEFGPVDSPIELA